MNQQSNLGMFAQGISLYVQGCRLNHENEIFCTINRDKIILLCIWYARLDTKAVRVHHTFYHTLCFGIVADMF